MTPIETFLAEVRAAGAKDVSLFFRNADASIENLYARGMMELGTGRSAGVTADAYKALHWAVGEVRRYKKHVPTMARVIEVLLEYGDFPGGLKDGGYGDKFRAALAAALAGSEGGRE